MIQGQTIQDKRLIHMTVVWYLNLCGIVTVNIKVDLNYEYEQST